MSCQTRQNIPSPDATWRAASLDRAHCLLSAGDQSLISVMQTLSILAAQLQSISSFSPARYAAPTSRSARTLRNDASSVLFREQSRAPMAFQTKRHASAVLMERYSLFLPIALSISSFCMPEVSRPYGPSTNGPSSHQERTEPFSCGRELTGRGGLPDASKGITALCASSSRCAMGVSSPRAKTEQFASGNAVRSATGAVRLFAARTIRSAPSQFLRQDA